MQVRNSGISQSFGTHSLLRLQYLVGVCRHRGSCGWLSEGKNTSNPGQRWEERHWKCFLSDDFLHQDGVRSISLQ